MAAQRRLVVEGAVLDATVGVEDQAGLGSPPSNGVPQRRSGQLGIASLAQALTESDGLAEDEIALAWRWIICSMKL